jgi:hypothetical protein
MKLGLYSEYNNSTHKNNNAESLKTKLSNKKYLKYKILRNTVLKSLSVTTITTFTIKQIKNHNEDPDRNLEKSEEKVTALG